MTTDCPKILLADDEEVFRLSTVALLEREGFRCDSARDSEEASKLLSNQHDVLISDIRMPGNAQMEFLRGVRVRMPLLPIIVVTGYPSVETAIDSLRLSFTDYLLKPVDWSELRRSVFQAVARARAARCATDGLGTVTDVKTTGPVQVEPAGAETSGHQLNWTLKNYLAQNINRMNVMSANLNQTLAGIAEGTVSTPTDVCEFMQCPRQVAYKEALLETVEVLERTKHAFKSKDLGELRRRLEGLLKESSE
jgi:DNA-binding response OmpR family regulator